MGNLDGMLVSLAAAGTGIVDGDACDENDDDDDCPDNYDDDDGDEVKEEREDVSEGATGRNKSRTSISVGNKEDGQMRSRRAR